MTTRYLQTGRLMSFSVLPMIANANTNVQPSRLIDQSIKDNQLQQHKCTAGFDRNTISSLQVRVSAILSTGNLKQSWHPGKVPTVRARATILSDEARMIEVPHYPMEGTRQTQVHQSYKLIARNNIWIAYNVFKTIMKRRMLVALNISMRTKNVAKMNMQPY